MHNRMRRVHSIEGNCKGAREKREREREPRRELSWRDSRGSGDHLSVQLNALHEKKTSQAKYLSIGTLVSIEVPVSA